MTWKKLFTPPPRTPPSPEALEQQEKEKKAYREGYNRSQIESARRRGRREGLGREQKKSGGHGIMGTLGTINKGRIQVGEFGLQMQNNLNDMLTMGQPHKTRKRKR